MEETKPSLLQNKKIILVIVIILILVASAFAYLSNRSTTKQTEEQKDTSPTVKQVKYPKSYNNEPISDKYLTQAVEKNKNNPEEATVEDMIDYVERYFIYKDVLTENNITIPQVDETSLNAITDAVQTYHKLVIENLVSQSDFVYIKARFGLYPTTEIEAQIKKEVPNVQDKARQLVEKYREKLAGQIVNAQQILNEANADPELTQINYEDKNEFIRGYNSGQNLFFTDPNFNQFLFSQTRGNVSDMYELKQDGQAYAYLVVYPTSITVKKYKTVDDIINEKRGKFNY